MSATFDTAALRDDAVYAPVPPADPAELARVWAALLADLVAAADEIERLRSGVSL